MKNGQENKITIRFFRLFLLLKRLHIYVNDGGMSASRLTLELYMVIDPGGSLPMPSKGLRGWSLEEGDVLVKAIIKAVI